MRKIALLIISIFILTGCAYQNIFNPTEIEEAIDTLMVVRTEAIIKDDNKSVMKATAFSIGNGYIIALTHATKTPGYITSSRVVLSEKHFIKDKEIKLIGRYKDISLFKSDIDNALPFELGDSDAVRVGTKVIVIGWSFGVAVNVKNGIVSRIDVGDIYGEIAKDCFLITAPTNPGDSGSPMLARRGERWEVVGIVNAGIRDKGMGFAIKVNAVKDAIRRIRAEAK